MNKQEKLEFFDYLLAHSELSAKEALELTEVKAANQKAVEELSSVVKLGKSIPINFIEGFDDMSEPDKNKVLWELGLDTKHFNYVIDVTCYRYGSISDCGRVAYGSERVDKEWLSKRIEGKRAASEEALFYKDRDVLAVLRGNKKV